MEFKLLKTEEDYHHAVQTLEKIGDSEEFQTSEQVFQNFELLAKLIELYEQEHFPIEHADPIEIIKLKMEYMGLARKDLLGIASSGVLSEVFNKKRSLSKTMIREFSSLLHIDQNLLNPGGMKVGVQQAAVIEKPVNKKRPRFGFLDDARSTVETFAGFVKTNHMVFNISPV